MREHTIEQALVRAVTETGGMCLKFTSPGTRGVPDRIALMPGGRIVFVEVKAPGRRPTRLQRIMHDRLRALGFTVVVIDSMEDIREVAG